MEPGKKTKLAGDSTKEWHSVPDDPTLEVTKGGLLRSWRPKGKSLRSSRGEWYRLSSRPHPCAPPRILVLYTTKGGERQVPFLQVLYETFVGPLPEGQRVMLREGAALPNVEDLVLAPDLRRHTREAQVKRASTLIETNGYRSVQKTSGLSRDVLEEALFLVAMKVLTELRSLGQAARRLKTPLEALWLVLNRQEVGRALVWDVLEGEKARKALERKQGATSPRKVGRPRGSTKAPKEPPATKPKREGWIR